MGFDALLGNGQLKKNLENSIRSGHMSHFYLISGPEGSGKRTLARLLAAAALCRGGEKPCLGCPSCRKVLDGVHPDLITVEDPEHKNVSIKLVRQARDDAFIRPNEADRKVYIFPQPLGLEGQNALLKLLEEPPAYGVFLLLTDNPEKLLPTVRSRCVGLSLSALPESVLRAALEKEFPQLPSQTREAAMERSGGFLGQAKAILQEDQTISPQTQGFVESFARRDAMGLLQTLVPMEKWKRDRFVPELQQWQRLLAEALACRAGRQAVSPQARLLGEGRSPRELMQAQEQLAKCLEYAQGNVSCAAVCGYLVWALK